MKFKIGQIVKISTTSVYYKNQGYHGIGKITEIKDGWYTVKFDDGYQDGYRYKDLIKISWKQMYK